MRIPQYSIYRVSNYLALERVDYENNPWDGHIYHHIKVVDEWLASVGEHPRLVRTARPVMWWQFDER
jgi:hypothetical protein